jgi:hypothetical protein
LDQRQTQTNSFTQQTQPQHTTNNTTNMTTMVPTARRLPAASILKVSKITVRRVIDNNLSNTAMLFFYVKLMNALFY